ncbi:MAG TPA: low affinity iron permease family protein [Rudaea sp.]|nr:low affinity iron permease family protein [Rudaea sp.]
MKKSTWFSRMAKSASKFTGRPLAFNLAMGAVILWVITGPIFKFSDTWQLVINTGTTIITFLMVFLIQNSQNRDTVAIQIKLDEIIRATAGAHNALLDLEELEEDDIELFHSRYCKLAAAARDTLDHRTEETGTPDVDATEPETDSKAESEDDATEKSSHSAQSG